MTNFCAPKSKEKSGIKVIIAGGGTGGHLYPGIAIAAEFQSRKENIKVYFVGTKKGIESRVLPQLSLPIFFTCVQSLHSSGFGGKICKVARIFVSLLQSVLILARLRPDLVLGMGGYVSFPLLFVTSLLQMPTVIHEQNAVLGISNKRLVPLVNLILLGNKNAMATLGKVYREKAVFTGNPVRQSILEVSSRDSVASKDFCVLVFGGSTGAHKLNVTMVEALHYLEDFAKSIRFIHQTGEADFNYVGEAYRARGFRAEVFDYIDDMGFAYAHSSLVICRAGALTIAELAVLGKPAILIPYPYATGDHQVSNAKMCVECGAAKMILDNQLTGEVIAEEIKLLYKNSGQLECMAENMRKQGMPDAASRVVDACMKLLSIYV